MSFSLASMPAISGSVILALLTSVIALYYYVTVIRRMYFPSDLSDTAFPVSRSLVTALTIAAIGVLYFGIFPGSFVSFVQGAANALLVLK